MPISAPPKFKLLVCHGRDSVDYGGNLPPPARTRSQFTIQQVTLTTGNGRIGGPIQAIPAPSLAAHTVAIKVLADTFYDPTVVAPPPFIDQEEIQVFNLFLVAGEEFAQGLGSGVGTVDAIATSLALALNRIHGVQAVATGDTVYITSSRLEETMAIKASNDTEAILSGYMFQVLGPAGEVMTTAPNGRRTYQMVKAVKSQSAPEILP